MGQRPGHSPTPPDVEAHHGLSAASTRDEDLSQESVRAAGHLPGPRSWALSIPLGGSRHGQDSPES